MPALDLSDVPAIRAYYCLDCRAVLSFAHQKLDGKFCYADMVLVLFTPAEVLNPLYKLEGQGPMVLGPLPPKVPE